MPADHRERAFEVVIEERLVAHGGYRRLDDGGRTRVAGPGPEHVHANLHMY